MQLEGSCHCQAVRFSLTSTEPVPYMRCYCSICRKTNGAGGYGINLGGDFKTLTVEGEEYIAVYRARVPDGEGGSKESHCERRFCKRCGSGLWVYSPEWPELVHPFASAIDSELPPAPEATHIMLGSKANWVPVEAGPNDPQFDRYPDESLADWHRRMGF
ncbi:MAG: GFA family protein [Gammaproteobacteria bacterium]|nr:GFA family protein [Gammaproteobacteria bacterium]